VREEEVHHQSRRERSDQFLVVAFSKLEDVSQESREQTIRYALRDSESGVRSQRECQREICYLLFHVLWQREREKGIKIWIKGEGEVSPKRDKRWEGGREGGRDRKPATRKTRISDMRCSSEGYSCLMICDIMVLS
jgi:hypothetical protein